MKAENADRIKEMDGDGNVVIRWHRDLNMKKTAGLIGVSLMMALLLCLISACDQNPCVISYWVATDGSDSASGDEVHPFLTLAHARDVIRSHKDRGRCSINVNIKGGTYRLAEPLTFNGSDSGAKDAEITYQSAPGEEVVISGAEQVSGWTLHDAALNIWKAQVIADTMPRQLYANGRRATRARTPDYPNYYFPGDTGYKYFYLIGTDPQIPPTWSNPALVEAVTVTQWKMMRCPVAEVIDNIVDYSVIMATPCWTNANVFPYPWNFHLLSWWENAYEFLDEPGEWYLDPGTKTLYYIPRAGEDMAAAEVELPVLEKLVDAAGDASSPVSNIGFKGLNFMYATWYGPNGADGYALDQSGFHLVGTDHSPNIIGHDPNAVGIPGNVSFLYAQDIAFEDNAFAHMGAVALNFGTGSQNNEIVNNTFTDTSAAAIQLGGIALQDHHPETDSQLTRDNRIANNLIEYAGQEFYDAPGIYIGFTTRSTVEHNDIMHVPWSGIAIGWGWGLLDPGGFPGLPHATQYEWGVYDTPSAAQGNQILNNKMQYFLEKLWDGGAIYTTGFQGTSLADGQVISGNVAMNKRPEAGGNTFYTDGGSRYVTLKENVSLGNPQGFVDFGPCLKDSSFPELCLTTGIVPYGADMGGCVPYGDLVFESNYLRDHLDFYDICTNDYYPGAPFNMTFIDNVKVSNASEVPASIIEAAGCL
ncbi:MAG: right-handed parallel beta-helix repeat-containing protein [Proteobacteria bacterium]|nr:right-handed parallel beta-helix repeat-containing protein [Pseudomonadota bacterium]